MCFRRETKKVSIDICVALGRVILRMFLPLFDPKRKLSNLRITPIYQRHALDQVAHYLPCQNKKVSLQLMPHDGVAHILYPENSGSELANVDTRARAFTTAMQIRGVLFGTRHRSSGWCIANKSGNFNSNVFSVIFKTCHITVQLPL